MQGEDCRLIFLKPHLQFFETAMALQLLLGTFTKNCNSVHKANGNKPLFFSEPQQNDHAQYIVRSLAFSRSSLGNITRADSLFDW